MGEPPKEDFDASWDRLLDQPADPSSMSARPTDPNWRLPAQMQERIDDSLRRQFAPPLGGGWVERAEADDTSKQRAKRLLPKPFWRSSGVAAAAAILIFAVAGFQIWTNFLRRPDHYRPQPFRTMEQVYHDTVAGGMKPGWICENDRQLRDAFRKGVGQPLFIASVPGVKAGGLDYCHTLSPSTMVVLANVEGHNVIVLADRLKHDKSQPQPKDSDLHLFRREMDGVVLYELTPLDQPRVLELLSIPDVPP